MSDRTCSLGECDRRYYAKGYCRAHYFRWVKVGDPQPGIPVKGRRETRGGCSVEDCGRQHYAKGWCQSHYNRWKKHGDIRADVPVEDRNPRDGTCLVEGCDRPIGLRLLCVAHARRENKHGDVVADIPLIQPSDGRCSVEGCVRPYSAKGWCEYHYQPFRRYKLTPDDYDTMLAIQGGGCAICGRVAGEATRLFVDHDHACCPARVSTCGKCVRGLLCASCNPLLGRAGDSIEWLQRAIDYLKGAASADHPAS